MKSDSLQPQGPRLSSPLTSPSKGQEGDPNLGVLLESHYPSSPHHTCSLTTLLSLKTTWTQHALCPYSCCHKKLRTPSHSQIVETARGFVHLLSEATSHPCPTSEPLPLWYLELTVSYQLNPSNHPLLIYMYLLSCYSTWNLPLLQACLLSRTFKWWILLCPLCPHLTLGLSGVAFYPIAASRPDVGKLFLKRPWGKYFSLCLNYSTLLLYDKASHRQHANEWTYLYFNKNVFVKVSSQLAGYKVLNLRSKVCPTYFPSSNCHHPRSPLPPYSLSSILH